MLRHPGEKARAVGSQAWAVMVRRKNLLLALLLLPMTAVSVWGISRVEDVQRREVAAALDTVLRVTQTGLHLWARDVKEDVASWIHSPELRAAVEAQLKLPPNADVLKNSEPARKIRQILGPAISRVGHQGYAVIAPDGLQIAALLEGDVGSYRLIESDPATILSALAGKVKLGLPFQSTVPIPLDTGSWYPGYPSMVVAGPITDSVGNVIAALAFRLDPSADFTRVVRMGRIGRSSETYAFDSRGRFLTESRFDQELLEMGLLLPGQRAILSLEVRDPGKSLLEGFRPKVDRDSLPFTRMAKAALSGESGSDVMGYRDYRGSKVVGAWLWDREMNIGLATEMDLNQAYQALRVARATVIFMLLVMLAGAAVAAWVLARRARYLAEAVGREKRALKARDDVLQVISHDLRNPLNIVSLSTGLILKEEEGRISSMVKKYVQAIQRSALRMSHLIDDLMQTSLIEAGRLRLDRQPISPADLAERAHEAQEPLASEKGILLANEVEKELPHVDADERRILRVFSNLIGNAIKFTPDGGTIRIWAKPEGASICFGVSDSGPGISESERSYVFDRYWQSQNTSGKGVGLGLFIARQIVEAHGGHIWVESIPGRGATFCFTVPTVPGRSPLGEDWPHPGPN
jgi:signal transduction histidine kinase